MENKPLTLWVQETESNIVEIINKSGLPVFCLKQIIQDVFKQLDTLDNQEIEAYKKELEQKNKKESDK